MATGYVEPNTLLDAIIDARDLKNDAALARFLRFKPGVISKVRNRRIVVSEEFRMRVMRCTGWSLAKVDKLAPFDDHPDSDGE